jgi:hypothetical protein
MPMSSQCAVIVAASVACRFSTTTAVRYPDSGAAQTSLLPSIRTSSPARPWTGGPSVSNLTATLKDGTCSRGTNGTCGSPWLTAITSLLARMPYVSCDMCRTSQPMMSGACTRMDAHWTTISKALARFQNYKNRAFFSSEKKRQSTFEIAQRLKCTMHSLFVIPPLPTSSMSGSAKPSAREHILLSRIVTLGQMGEARARADGTDRSTRPGRAYSAHTSPWSAIATMLKWSVATTTAAYE